MEIEVAPEPDEDVRAALAEALGPRSEPDEYSSAWRLAALRSPVEDADP